MKKKILLIASLLLVALVWTGVQFAASDNLPNKQESEISDKTPELSCSTEEMNFLEGTFDEPLKIETVAQNCLSATSRKKDGQYACGAGDYTLKVYNGCNETLDIQMCLQLTNGKWSCGLDTKSPGGTSTFWSCDSTGYYKVWSRKPGSNVKFPEP